MYRRLADKEGRTPFRYRLKTTVPWQSFYGNIVIEVQDPRHARQIVTKPDHFSHRSARPHTTITNRRFPTSHTGRNQRRQEQNAVLIGIQPLFGQMHHDQLMQRFSCAYRQLPEPK